MKKTPITLVRNNTLKMSITVRDSEDALVDLTGYTMVIAVKRNPEDTDTNALIAPINAVIDTPASGVGAITIPKASTDIEAGEYYYDVTIYSATERYTIIPLSKFTIIENINKG